MPQVTNDSLIATGFLRSYAKVGFREKDNPEFRYEYLDDMIATIGRGVLGLTVQCARCHDHKFDPIRQADYYRLQSSLWGYVEVDQPLTSKEAADAWQAKNKEIDEKTAELKADLQDSRNAVSRSAAARQIQEIPAEHTGCDRHAGGTAHARPGAAGESGDPHGDGFRRRDRPHHFAWRQS